jgi:signal transduction histidine kinase
MTLAARIQHGLNFVRQPTYGRTLLVLLTVAFIALLVTAVASFTTTRRAQTLADRVEHTQAVRAQVASIMQHVLNAETGQRGYLITGDEVYLGVHAAAVRELPAELDALERLVSDNPAQVERLRDLRDAVQTRIATLERAIQLRRSGDAVGATNWVALGRGRVQMQAVRAVVAAMDTEEARRLSERSAAAARANTVSLIVNLASAALVALVGSLSMVVVNRYVAELRRSKEEIAAINAGLEDTVRTRTEDLVRANEEIQRFAYIVSHDLRAPLVNVMGYTSELQNAATAITRQFDVLKAEAPKLVEKEAELAVREDVPEAIAFIRASTAKMDRLINAILRLSREGRRGLTPETIDMVAVCSQIAASLHHQTEAAGAEIIVQPMPSLVSDRLGMEQVFGNLLDNAVKYLDRSRPGWVIVRGREQGPFVVYEVQDNGRGIDPKDHERVFELFRRAGRQDTQGEGLGLAFVRNAVRRMGGSIELVSALGQGSTFILKFPKNLTVTRGDTE